MKTLARFPRLSLVVMRKILKMKIQNISRSDRSSISQKIFIFNLLILILAGILDRLFYIKYLNQNGYGLKDVIVPWQMLIEYHSSGIGLFWAIIMCVSIVSVILILWGPFNLKRKENIA